MSSDVVLGASSGPAEVVGSASTEGLERTEFAKEAKEEGRAAERGVEVGLAELVTAEPVTATLPEGVMEESPASSWMA